LGSRASWAGGLLFFGCCLNALADSAAPDGAPHVEYFTGFEVSDNYASAYVGGGYAFGKAGLWGPGFRLRAVGAYGPYHYDGALPVDGIYRPTRFDGEAAYLAALLGYQVEPGRMILKLSPASRRKTSTSFRAIQTIRCKAACLGSGCKPMARTVREAVPLR